MKKNNRMALSHTFTFHVLFVVCVRCVKVIANTPTDILIIEDLSERGEREFIELWVEIYFPIVTMSQD